MPGIGRMRLARHDRPPRVIEARKKSIGALDRGVDMGQIHARGERQAQRIHLAATDHAQLACTFLSGQPQRFIHRRNRLHARERHPSRARQHQVAPSGQRTTQRRGGLAPHQHRLAQRERLEALEVIGQPPRQLTTTADGVSPVQRRDQHQSHARPPPAP